MTDPLDLSPDAVEPENLPVGEVCWHCSDLDGGPDVGLSVVLQPGTMLFLGEVPGADRPGWTLALYRSGHERLDLASAIELDDARDGFEAIAKHIRALSARVAELEARDVVRRDDVAGLAQALGEQFEQVKAKHFVAMSEHLPPCRPQDLALAVAAFLEALTKETSHDP